MLSHEMRAQQLMTDPLFEMGNHTWEHRNLRVLTSDPRRSAVLNEILGGQRAYQRVRENLISKQCALPTGGSPAKYSPRTLNLFRFPFGACSKESIEAVNNAGLTAIQWDISSGDPWIGEMPDHMIREVVARVRPGSIILFHANGRGWRTPEALPHIVAELKARAYRFVTVGELLAAGNPVISETCYDSRPGDVERYDSLARSLEITYARAKLEVVGPGRLPANAASLAALPSPSTRGTPERSIAHSLAPDAKQTSTRVQETSQSSPAPQAVSTDRVVPPEPRRVLSPPTSSRRPSSTQNQEPSEDVVPWAKRLARPDIMPKGTEVIRTSPD
jgi:hypothetical protein